MSVSYRIPLLAVVAFALAVAGCAAPGRTAPSAAPVSDSAAIVADISYLASPALAGRLIGTSGNAKAAEFIAKRYESLGLRPLAADYRQPFIAHPPAREGGARDLRFPPRTSSR